MKTFPVMLRLDPNHWKQFQREAKDRDLTPAQLIRQVMREFLNDTEFYVPLPRARKKK